MNGKKIISLILAVLLVLGSIGSMALVIYVVDQVRDLVPIEPDNSEIVDKNDDSSVVGGVVDDQKENEFESGENTVNPDEPTSNAELDRFSLADGTIGIGAITQDNYGEHLCIYTTRTLKSNTEYNIKWTINGLFLENHPEAGIVQLSFGKHRSDKLERERVAE